MKEAKLERETPLVLVVDDDRLIRIMERNALEQAGFSVEEAENGAAAISALERLQPDAVLLDVLMPELDGFSACAAMRNLPGGDLAPILIATALDDLKSSITLTRSEPRSFSPSPSIGESWATMCGTCCGPPEPC
jgi:CheY-like chemotaxis protein